MDIKLALKRQYHASFMMIRQAVERCPDDLWAANDHPRDFWRIAYHALYYTHLYLFQKNAAFEPWGLHRDDNAKLWARPWKPGKGPVPYTKAEILDYLTSCDNFVDEAVDALNLEAESSGFSWYKMPKFEHQLVNLRHIHQHSGQLSEILMSREIDTDWFARPDVPM